MCYVLCVALCVILELHYSDILHSKKTNTFVYFDERNSQQWHWSNVYGLITY